MAKRRRRRNQEWIYIGVAAAVLVCMGLLFWLLGGSGAEDHDHDHDHEGEETVQTEQQSTHKKGNYIAEINISDYGTITLELETESAPITVKNFVKLAKEGFYDGLTFHRIISGFMMQGGAPEGTGFGGSDQTIKGEFPENGVENLLSHTRGAISMARRGNDYDSASSQFFICHKDSKFLDGAYAVFGYVTEGMDVVDAVCRSANPIDNNGTIPAKDQPIIKSITVSEIK